MIFKKITKEELELILYKHERWLNDEDDGEKACLSKIDLTGFDLSNVNLCQADLSYSKLHKVNLSNAKLISANLMNTFLADAILDNANLEQANLMRAFLTGASLVKANCKDANLKGASLGYATLQEADLRCACLDYTNLNGTNLKNAIMKYNSLYDAYMSTAKNIPYIPMICPEVGSFIDWKKASGLIVKLEILEDALRSSGAGRKCRCNKAKVLAIENADGSLTERKSVNSTYDNNFAYKVGEIAEEPNFCTDRWKECAPGIHFFINRQEAVDFNFT